MALDYERVAAAMFEAKDAVKFEVRMDQCSFDFESEQKYVSPVHYAGEMPCALFVYPKGNPKDSSPTSDPSNVSAYLVVIPASSWLPGWQFKDVNFAITLRLPCDYSMESDTFTFNESTLDRGWHSFKKLKPAQRKLPGALNDGKLVFNVAVWGDLGKKPEALPALPAPGFQHLWTEPRQFTDMIIKTDSGAEFRCHRNVISSSSEVLGRMLVSDFKEAHEATITIRDARDSDVRAMLEHIYTGRLTHTLELGTYTVVHPRLVVSNAFNLGSEYIGEVKSDQLVELLEIVDMPELHRVRGRIAEPVDGWITLVRHEERWAVPVAGWQSYDLLNLSKLADMYSLSSLTLSCATKCLRTLAGAPTHENVRSLAQAMRKRPRNDAGDELMRITRRRLQSNPTLIDAFFDAQ